jgi:hypothetical protein
MKPVVQLDRTGCGIACVAALTGLRYRAVKSAAAELGIDVADSRLWSGDSLVRRLLNQFQVRAGAQKDFTGWSALPECALLAIKWHRERTGPAWHWVVFVRDASGQYVLDSKRALSAHRRTDFGRIKPKWFIPLRMAV